MFCLFHCDIFFKYCQQQYTWKGCEIKLSLQFNMPGAVYRVLSPQMREINNYNITPRRQGVYVFSHRINIKCYCVETPLDNTVVLCAICGNGQHAECVRFIYDPNQIVPHLCDDCWSVNERLQCQATLIVVPHSTLNEWTDEASFLLTYSSIQLFRVY